MSNTLSKKSDLPLKVGITGGIGSGKSLACSIFHIFGIPIFDADTSARNLYSAHDRVKEQMVHWFGPEVYLPTGEIDRGYLASRIFNDVKALEAVNQLIHPLVREAFTRWHQQQSGPYVLFESALLFETGTWHNMDLTLLVTAPCELRIQRVMQRDRLPRETVLARMHRQWEEEKKKELAAITIINDEEHSLLEQILSTDQKIKELWEISVNG